MLRTRGARGPGGGSDPGAAPRKRAGAARAKKAPKPSIGWREWVSLPDFGVEAVKAKVDTGARSSSLHAYDLEHLTSGGRERVRFTIHPMQRSGREGIVVVAELLDRRWVRSSSGHRELRPVVRTSIAIDGRSWPIELTLTNRDDMGFRMLLGREALRGRFVVDPGRSYVSGRRPKATEKAKPSPMAAPPSGSRERSHRGRPRAAVFDEE